MSELGDFAAAYDEERKPGPKCWLCKRPELKAEVFAFVRRGGKRSTAHAWLVAEHGCDVGQNVIQRCYREHQ